MKSIETVSVTSTLIVNLQFRASLVSILNPTQKTLFIRAGGNDVPGSVAASSYICPPASAVNLPIAGTDFAFGFGLPQLTNAPDGLPTQAQITFLDAREPAPVFGSMPLATTSTSITPAPQTIVKTVPVIASSPTTITGIAIASALRSLSVVLVGTATWSNFSAVTITGEQSGIVYLQCLPATDVTSGMLIVEYACPVYSALDTSVKMVIQGGVGKQLTVIGHQTDRQSRTLIGNTLTQPYWLNPSYLTVNGPNGGPLSVRPTDNNGNVINTTNRLSVELGRNAQNFFTIQASAALAGSNVFFVNNPTGYQRLSLLLNITNMGGGVGLVMNVGARDPVGLQGYDLHPVPGAGASANATGSWGFQVGAGLPSVTARSGGLLYSVGQAIGQQLYVWVRALDGATYTYSLTGEWLP